MLGRKLYKERKWKKIGQCGKVRGKRTWGSDRKEGRTLYASILRESNMLLKK